MTTVKIKAGICGFTTQVKAEGQPGYKAVFQMESQCPNWRKFNETLGNTEINVMGEFFKNKATGELESQIMDLALRTIPHVSCPVISGLLKAIEVSSGLALPQDATITFEE